MKTLLVCLLCVGEWILICAAIAEDREARPEPSPGMTVPAKVVHVVDGDTVDVDVTLRVRVRLLDCWAPESRTRDLEEKKRGLAASAYLRQVLDGKQVLLQIPFTKHQTSVDKGVIDAQSLLTFDRVLGRLWFHGRDVSTIMVEAGHATATK